MFEEWIELRIINSRVFHLNGENKYCNRRKCINLNVRKGLIKLLQIQNALRLF